MKKSAYLVGPFIGELEWEFYRFAPYIINLKKNNPDCILIVYTRPSRFDLYGRYADILVPLNLKSDESFVKKEFGIESFDIEKYNILVKYLYKKYSERYTIVNHIYPDIGAWRRKVKWQFPRDEMCYDFEPRKNNHKVIDGLFDSTSSVFVCINDSEIRHSLYHHGHDPIMIHWLEDVVKNQSDGIQSSFIGCLIMILKQCDFVVGNLSSSAAKLALLLNIPVVSINEKMDYDAIYLINPFDTPVINCVDIDEGVNIYENNL